MWPHTHLGCGPCWLWRSCLRLRPANAACGRGECLAWGLDGLPLPCLANRYASATWEPERQPSFLQQGHRCPGRKCLALLFAVFLGVYASAVIKGAALLLGQIVPVPVWILIWAVAIWWAFAVFVGGLRGVLYTGPCGAW